MINELEALYSSIHSGSMQSIVNGHETIDPLLNARENDTRFGITLLIPLGTSIASEISSIRDEIRKIEPGQYFYPASDLHVTVLDLQSAHESFQRDNERIEESIRLIEMAISGIAQFDIDFRGIIFSNAGILLKGYYYNGLETIRTRIRERSGRGGDHASGTVPEHFGARHLCTVQIHTPKPPAIVRVCSKGNRQSDRHHDGSRNAPCHS